MSLVDVIIQVLEHPATQFATPLIAKQMELGQRRTLLRIQNEEWEARQSVLTSRGAASPLPDISDGMTVTVAGGLAGLAASLPDSTGATAKSDDLYTRDNRYDTGCAVCGKAHLAATAGMIDRANKIAAERGQCDADCIYYLSAAQREVANLTGYDWTPALIAQTPPGEQAVLNRWLPSVESLQTALFSGPESTARQNLAQAAGALEEAGRFARASGVDHPEAQQRIADAEALLAETERGEWSPERRQSMDPATRQLVDQALPAFRRQRQFLLNGLNTPEDLDRVAAEVGTLNAQMQTVALAQWTPDQIAQVAQQAQAVRQGFREDLRAQHSPQEVKMA